ncbi:helix-turn-helix domain-containing protein [Dyadobacter frigoris]|uniref:AraC family transcriptional regulator n=1 Tax=Dyadobacter frigoris TaxID=2576211 RepID=A0A4V6BJ06_9BACT|nr:helix-turn-helix domain-containing protein [Dyadobacter frigoris]TKT92493.1 AraC family transcriptional regulator [Dyadobacter frigoris]
MADQLNIPLPYLGDLLKQETRKTALELIRVFLISEVKNLLMGSGHNITEIANALGFETLPYFLRLFKNQTGVSLQTFLKSDLELRISFFETWNAPPGQIRTAVMLAFFSGL